MCMTATSDAYVTDKDIVCYVARYKDGKHFCSPFRDTKWMLNKLKKTNTKQPELRRKGDTIAGGFFHSLLTKEKAFQYSWKIWIGIFVFRAIIPSGSVVIMGNIHKDSIGCGTPCICSNQLMLVEEVT